MGSLEASSYRDRVLRTLKEVLMVQRLILHGIRAQVVKLGASPRRHAFDFALSVRTCMSAVGS